MDAGSVGLMHQNVNAAVVHKVEGESQQYSEYIDSSTGMLRQNVNREMQR